MKPAWEGWARVCKIVPVGRKKYLGKKPSTMELAFKASVERAPKRR
jgi:hypothetical protein